MGGKTPEEAFTNEKLELSHLRIFGCQMYIHVPKEKRTQTKPSRKKGTFVGYSESSNACRIYIPGQRHIEVSRDVTFDEEITFQRSKESHIDVDCKEHEAPQDAKLPVPDTHTLDDQREEPNDPIDPIEPIEHVDGPRDVVVAKRRPTWLCETLREVKKHASPQGSFRESRRPYRFLSYMEVMSHIIDLEPSTYEDAG